MRYDLKRKKGTRSLKISTNKIYAGLHWGQRKSIKDRILDTAGRVCSPIQVIESYPVEIGYRFVFSTRPLDTLNTAYMAKMFEDAFRSLGILKDDDPRHVAKTILEVVALPREKRKKVRNDKGKEIDEKDQDYVEITIKDYQS